MEWKQRAAFVLFFLALFLSTFYMRSPNTEPAGFIERAMLQQEDVPMRLNYIEDVTEPHGAGQIRGFESRDRRSRFIQKLVDFETVEAAEEYRIDPARPLVRGEPVPGMTWAPLADEAIMTCIYLEPVGQPADYSCSALARYDSLVTEVLFKVSPFYGVGPEGAQEVLNAAEQRILDALAEHP